MLLYGLDRDSRTAAARCRYPQNVVRDGADDIKIAPLLMEAG